MNAVEEQCDLALAGWLPHNPGGLPGAREPWLAEVRADAGRVAAELGVPTKRHEAWRYTGLKGLVDAGFTERAERTEAPSLDDLSGVLLPQLQACRIVLVNGFFEPRLSTRAALPPGVRLGSLGQMLANDASFLRGRLASLAQGAEAGLFTALNTAGMDDGFVLMVGKDVALDCPIELIHLSVGDDLPRLMQPRNLLALEEGASATVIERHLSLNQGLYCTNSVTEVLLGAGAELRHERIQDESTKAFHIAGVYLSQAERSRYRGTNIAIGAAWSRTDIKARFSAPGAECDLSGLFLAGDGQHVDFHLDVIHAHRECSSRELFKGILFGEGRGVFDGRVLVERDAQGTNAQMSNRNLLLSRAAEIDTKPQLEILADDVKCSHGTTVGQIEPEMLFYLRSRGISAPVARRMLCLGFAAEVVDGLSCDALRAHVSEKVGGLLERAPIDID